MKLKELFTGEQNAPDTLKIFSQKIIIILAFVSGIYILSILIPVLIIVFFSGFLTILFSSFLGSMNAKRIPDWLGIICILFGIMLFFLITILAIVPIFIQQIALLFSYIGSSFNTWESLYKGGGIQALGLPFFLQSSIENIDLGMIFELARSHIASLSSIIASLSSNIVQGSTSIIASLSGGIFQGIMILLFTFFMSLERHAIKKFLYEVFPDSIREYLLRREDSFLKILESWMKGQIILALSITLLTFLGLLGLRIFGIHVGSIFTLALIAGLMEFIPYIGPFLALLPALALAASMGYVPVVAIFVLYIIIQQVENNVLVPMVMSKTLNLSPFLILLMMMIMLSLLGIVGVLLAIPFAAVCQIVVRDLLDKKIPKENKKTLR